MKNSIHRECRLESYFYTDFIIQLFLLSSSTTHISKLLNNFRKYVDHSRGNLKFLDGLVHLGESRK